jgi:hypothetical protein
LGKAAAGAAEAVVVVAAELAPSGGGASGAGSWDREGTGSAAYGGRGAARAGSGMDSGYFGPGSMMFMGGDGFVQSMRDRGDPYESMMPSMSGGPDGDVIQGGFWRGMTPEEAERQSQFYA